MLLPSDENEILNKYMTMAMKYDDVSFAHSHADEHMKALDIISKYGLVIFR